MELRGRIEALGPWHFDFQLDGVRTGEFRGDLDLLTEQAGEAMKAKLLKIYPNGLEGRSVLDCACNCGAYLFAAKEVGAGTCFGFDVREHWINQARFLAEYREETDISFEVCNLYDLDTEPFDVVLFNGIFYHLHDPITGLKIAADLCRETLCLNTAIKEGPEGALLIAAEHHWHPLSGVEGPNWFPTGAKTLEPVLRWLGFSEIESRVWPNRKGHNLDLTGRRSSS